MTYHLARVAYYIQHNNFNYYDANYWAQVTHPKNSSILLLYTYLVSGRNENLTKLVQYFSYWISVLSVFAISCKTGMSKKQSIFAATVSALLIICLMESTTTQNDMLISAYFGTTVYFLFVYRENYQWKYLVLSAACIGLSIGTKSSSLPPLLSVGLISIYIFIRLKISIQRRLSNFAIFCFLSLMGICIFALPSGYLENLRIFGNPIGPLDVREIHSFEGKPLNFIAYNGTKNLMRYVIDFFSLDGLPNVRQVKIAQDVMRKLCRKIVNATGIDLEDPEATRVPFKFIEIQHADENWSFWGIFGFGLIWIMVFLSFVGIIKHPDIRILSLASLIFLISQSYLGPYDPWRGRYFTICAIFAAPVIGSALLSKKRIVQMYLFLIVWLGCISAISAIILRTNIPLISINTEYHSYKSILYMGRIEQLTISRYNYTNAFETFNNLVPKNATVALYLPADSYEYPFFGKYLTRTIIPINSFFKGIQKIPNTAEYLLYTEIGFPCPPLIDDIHLGEDWYLRILTDSNRDCP